MNFATAAVTAITAIGPQLEAVGAALISIAVIAVTVKWVKAMIFS